MQFLIFLLALIASLGTAFSVAAQTVPIDKSFRAHGIPGVELTDTGQIGYEFVYLYKLVDIRGKLGLCGAVVTNSHNKHLRKFIGVTVASLGGVQLKRGLNYMPTHEAAPQVFKDARLTYLARSYVWKLDPSIALGKRANCRAMRPAWSNELSAATVAFTLPKMVWVNP